MTSKLTDGVTISVETFYQPEHSNAQLHEYMFAYRITIDNKNAFPIKLISRHWHIFDGDGTTREVEGEGVVGIQPEINTGDRYQYISGCNLKTEIGKMFGTFLMENMYNKKRFEVNIPSFEMVAPEKLN